MRYTNIFSHFVGCLFIFFNNVVWCTKIVLNEVTIYFFFFVHVFGVISKSVLPNSRLWRFTTFSTKNVLCVSPILRFLVHSELTFVCDVSLGSSFILLHMGIQLSQDHSLKIFFFPLNRFGTLVKDQFYSIGPNIYPCSSTTLLWLW